jgi:flagellar biogenesis protein FliO
MRGCVTMSLFIFAGIGGFHIGDMLFALVSFSMLLAIIIGIVLLFTKVIPNTKAKRTQLNRIEEKMDEILKNQ